MIDLVETPAALERVAARASCASRLAVDAEANGLHAFRTALCVLQLAWPEGDAIAIAIVDALAVDVGPLAPLLGPSGPTKVLHDLTLDARLLAERGAPLGAVRDTSVAARLLGFAATGLAALLASELGVSHGKGLQRHDWSQRPIGDAELEYLAGDVRHLLALDDVLAKKADALDVAAEIADECTYKLATALDPPRDARPAYARIKGVASLDAVGRAVLRRLCAARDEAAGATDVPPFKVAANEVLLELATVRPRTLADVAAVRGATAGLAARFGDLWLDAIAKGEHDGDVPEADRSLFDPAPPSRDRIARRRVRESQVNAWRKAEAARRGVDAQAVLPGHCAHDLVEALVAHDDRPDAAALEHVVANIRGIGARRLERYAGAFLALAASRA